MKLIYLRCPKLALCSSAVYLYMPYALNNNLKCPGDVFAYHKKLQANALGRAGQWLLVLDMLKEMKAAGYPPTEVAFKAAVHSCSKVSFMVR